MVPLETRILQQPTKSVQWHFSASTSVQRLQAPTVDPRLLVRDGFVQPANLALSLRDQDAALLLILRGAPRVRHADQESYAPLVLLDVQRLRDARPEVGEVRLRVLEFPLEEISVLDVRLVGKLVGLASGAEALPGAVPEVVPHAVADPEAVVNH